MSFDYRAENMDIIMGQDSVSDDDEDDDDEDGMVLEQLVSQSSSAPPPREPAAATAEDEGSEDVDGEAVVTATASDSATPAPAASSSAPTPALASTEPVDERIALYVMSRARSTTYSLILRLQPHPLPHQLLAHHHQAPHPSLRAHRLPHHQPTALRLHPPPPLPPFFYPLLHRQHYLRYQARGQGRRLDDRPQSRSLREGTRGEGEGWTRAGGGGKQK